VLSDWQEIRLPCNILRKVKASLLAEVS